MYKTIVYTPINGHVTH